jgi:hypothetical protein
LWLCFLQFFSLFFCGDGVSMDNSSHPTFNIVASVG